MMPKKHAFNKHSRRTFIGRKFKSLPTQSPPQRTQIRTQIQQQVLPETEITNTMKIASPTTTNKVPLGLDPLCSNELVPQDMSSAGIVSNTGLRLAIAYIFIECYDLPPEEEWHSRNGTIAKILRTLNMTVNKRKVIKSVLENVTAFYKKGVEYTGVNEMIQVRDTKKIKKIELMKN